MYNFGQFRKTQLNSYMTNIDYTIEDLETQSLTSDEMIFLDKKIIPQNNLMPEENNQMKSYYLRLKIYKMLSIQKITLKLINTNKTEDNEQFLDEIEIPAGNKNEFFIYETVVTTNDIYNEIHLILSRTIEDYNIHDINNYYGRKMNIEVEKLTDVYNVINSISGVTSLKQIGIQSKPGLLMSIQGEGIHVGRSGIYEINNGYTIDYIGFIIEDEDDNTYFVLDYQY